MTCLPIQGSGYTHTGVDVFGFKSTNMRVKRHNRFKLMAVPAFHWREVTHNDDLWLKRRPTGFTGRMRMQYGYMVSTFPIGTFDIYSCLGRASFKVKRVG